jgi:hypothetical protein
MTRLQVREAEPIILLYLRLIQDTEVKIGMGMIVAYFNVLPQSLCDESGKTLRSAQLSPGRETNPGPPYVEAGMLVTQ